MEPISGYKCFNKGLTNRYGKAFELGVVYSCSEKLKFGNDGHGFHMCRNLEDTLRYFDTFNNEVDICQVKCFGNLASCDDDYNEFYNMYATEHIIIEKILSREEIIAYALKLKEYRLKRFISLYKLTKTEQELLKIANNFDETLLKYIAYYQNNDKHAFDIKEKVKTKNIHD